MSYSIGLAAERLAERGHHTRIFGSRSAQFDKVRLITHDNQSFEPGTLYVCERLPESLPSQSGYAFASTCAPSPSFQIPCLVVDSCANAPALLNALANMKDEIDCVFRDMREMAWEDEGVVQIVKALSKLVGNPTYVVDSSFKVMAITEDRDMEEMSVNWMHAARHGYLSYDLIAKLIRSNELYDIESTSKSTVVNSEYFYTPFANYNLRQEGKVQGHLFVVEMYKRITKGDLELIDLAATCVLRALQSNSSFQTSRGPQYEHFVIDWIEGNQNDPAYIRRQLDALSFNAMNLSAVAVIRLSIDSDFRREHLARLLEDRQGCRAVSHHGQVIALFQLKHHADKVGVVRKVRSICQSQQCRAFLSDVQDSFLETPRAYRQAREAMRICDAMGIADDVGVYGDVAAYQPYLNFSSPEELDAFCHPAIMTLSEHDRTHAVKLLPTLSSFLKNERDVQRTAAELFIHRNTLTYRVKRALEMCPVDLDDFGVRHRLLESILIVENRDSITAHMRNSNVSEIA